MEKMRLLCLVVLNSDTQKTGQIWGNYKNTINSDSNR